MLCFTDSPYEAMMQEKPNERRRKDRERLPCLPGSGCAGCAYGRSFPCIGVCMKELLDDMRRKAGQGKA